MTYLPNQYDTTQDNRIDDLENPATTGFILKDGTNTGALTIGNTTNNNIELKRNGATAFLEATGTITYLRGDDTIITADTALQLTSQGSIELSATTSGQNTNITYDTLNLATTAGTEANSTSGTFNINSDTVNLGGTSYVAPYLLTVDRTTSDIKAETGYLAPNPQSIMTRGLINTTIPLGDLSNTSSTVATNNQVLTWCSINNEWCPRDASTTHTHPLTALSDVSLLSNTTTGYDNLNATANLLFRYRAQDAVTTVGTVVSDWPADFAYNALSGFITNGNDLIKETGVNNLVCVRTPVVASPSRLKFDVGGSMRGKSIYLVFSDATWSNGNFAQIGAFPALPASQVGAAWFNQRFQSGPTNIGSSTGVISISTASIGATGTGTNSCYNVFNTLTAYTTTVPLNTITDFALDPNTATTLRYYEILCFNEVHTQGQRDNIVASLNQRYNPAPLSSQGLKVLKSNTDGTIWSANQVLVQEIGGNKYDATTAPVTGNDNTQGYFVGSNWVDVTNDRAYVCLDATTATAVWKETTSGSRYCAYFDDNAVSSGGTLNTFNWMQGTFIPCTANTSDFTLAANNTITYTGTATKIFDCIFSCTNIVTSNDRTVNIVAIKNPATIPVPLLVVPPALPSGYIAGSRVVEIIRTNIQDTTTVSGLFSVSLATNETLRIYVANMENNDAVTVVDFRLSIKQV
jgi:hypothetical protein